jgi:ribosome maturation factor RimP
VAAAERDLHGRISALASPHADELGVELVDVEVRGQRGSRVVRLVADADDGLDLDVIAELSRRVGGALDDAPEVIPGAYTLEVTSPGVDRPLTSARQFQRNVGRDVRVVRTRAAIDRGEKGEVTGRLAAAADGQLTLRVDKGRELVVPLEDVDHGRIVLPW